MSTDPEVWYMAGVWAWLTATYAGVIALLLTGQYAGLAAGSAWGLIVWTLWPHVALRVWRLR